VDTAIAYLPATVIVLTCLALCWATLARRLGYAHDAWIGLLMVIPGVNLVVFLWLAFSESPHERQLRELRTPKPASGAGPAPQLSGDLRCPACGAQVPQEAVACPSCDIAL
jgi:hypothetical protein